MNSNLGKADIILSSILAASSGESNETTTRLDMFLTDQFDNDDYRYSM